MPETSKTFGDVSISPNADHVAIVEIGRPPDNFFDTELISSLADAYAWLDGQPEFRAAVSPPLRGEAIQETIERADGEYAFHAKRTLRSYRSGEPNLDW